MKSGTPSRKRDKSRCDTKTKLADEGNNNNNIEATKKRIYRRRIAAQWTEKPLKSVRQRWKDNDHDDDRGTSSNSICSGTIHNDVAVDTKIWWGAWSILQQSQVRRTSICQRHLQHLLRNCYGRVQLKTVKIIIRPLSIRKVRSHNEV